ncbi:MAG: nuclear transport factor 2 family protein [Nocardioides sp.]
MTDTAESLRELERRRLRSLVDVDLPTAEELHAPDFELVNPGGSTWSRATYLGGIASGDIDYRRFEAVSEIDVLVDRDLAVLRYRSAIDIAVTGGTPGPLTGRHLDVYVRDTDGRWRVRWSQATEVVQPTP